MLKSSVCTQKQLQSEDFRNWAARCKEPERLHRKLWEFCYIAQALEERGMLQPGRRGLGFAVGREPLAALFASYGCEIVATDLDELSAGQAGWVTTGQHAAGLEALNQKEICPDELFQQRVQFRVVDMNALPEDLRGFDFIWSSCSIEHLGTIRRGQRFMVNMARCLKPGGVGVHTTEYNVSSNRETLSKGGDVLFRQKDIRRLQSVLQACGHRLAPLDFDTGNDPADLIVGKPPYDNLPHLKLLIDRFTSTSMGLIVTAGEQPSGFARFMARLRTREHAGCHLSSATSWYGRLLARLFA